MKYSDELGERLKAAYEEGMTIRDVAEEFTLSFGTARNYLLRAGAPLRERKGAYPAHDGAATRPQTYTPALGAKLKAAYERGNSIREVADQFGLKPGSTRKYLLRAGTSLRGQGAAGHSRGGPRRPEPTTRLRDALR